MSLEIEKLIPRFRKLRPYKDLSDAELRIKVKEHLEREESFNFKNDFQDKAEREQARELLERYLAEFTIETVSDKQILKDIIYYEVLNSRYKAILNEAYAKEKKSLPSSYVETLHQNSEVLMELKEKLGLVKKPEDMNDGYKAIELLKKKFVIHRQQNQGSRNMVCPYCSKMFLMKIKTEAWEAQKHPFFQDRILGNTHLINLFKDGKLTKEDLAKVFETSPDYVDWLVGKWSMPRPAENELPPAEESVRDSSHKTAPVVVEQNGQLTTDEIKPTTTDGPLLEEAEKKEEKNEEQK